MVRSDGITGLVDNAGIGTLWPMEAVPLGELRHQYEVNIFGQVAVIQAFLPLLRLDAGRILNIGSIGDRLMLPFAGPLNSSKQAFAAITEALRMELRSSGIRVVLIEPASIHTEAVEKVAAAADRVLDELESTASGRYVVPYRSMTSRGLARERNGSSPDVVARTVLRALSARRPRSRYLVGKDAHRLAFLARWLPDPLFDGLRLKALGLPTSLPPYRHGGRNPQRSHHGRPGRLGVPAADVVLRLHQLRAVQPAPGPRRRSVPDRHRRHAVTRPGLE